MTDTVQRGMIRIVCGLYFSAYCLGLQNGNRMSTGTDVDDVLYGTVSWEL